MRQDGRKEVHVGFIGAYSGDAGVSPVRYHSPQRGLIGKFQGMDSGFDRSIRAWIHHKLNVGAPTLGERSSERYKENTKEPCPPHDDHEPSRRRQYNAADPTFRQCR